MQFNNKRRGKEENEEEEERKDGRAALRIQVNKNTHQQSKQSELEIKSICKHQTTTWVEMNIAQFGQLI